MRNCESTRQLDIGSFLAARNGAPVGWGWITSTGTNTNREIWAADAANFSPDTAGALQITKFAGSHADCAEFKAWAQDQAEAANVTITWFEHVAVQLANEPC